MQINGLHTPLPSLTYAFIHHLYIVMYIYFHRATPNGYLYVVQLNLLK